MFSSQERPEARSESETRFSKLYAVLQTMLTVGERTYPLGIVFGLGGVCEIEIWKEWASIPPNLVKHCLSRKPTSVRNTC